MKQYLKSGTIAAILATLTWLGIRPRDIMSDHFIKTIQNIVNDYWYFYFICAVYFVIQTVLWIIASITGLRDYAKMKDTLSKRHEIIETEHAKAMITISKKFNDSKDNAMILFRWHKSGKQFPPELEETWDKLFKDFIR